MFPVPKKRGIKANQMIHVVYIVKPMNLDSLERKKEMKKRRRRKGDEEEKIKRNH